MCYLVWEVLTLVFCVEALWMAEFITPEEKGTNNSVVFAGDFAKADNLLQTAVV